MRKKALLMMGAAAVLAVSVSAGTFALFSDSKNAHREIVAGTLSLNSWRDQGDTIPGPMFYIDNNTDGVAAGPDGVFGTADDVPGNQQTGLWAPGDTHYKVLLVRNTGSLDAVLTSVGADLASGSMYMANKLQYVISTAVDIDAAGVKHPRPGTVIAAGNLGTLITTDQTLSPRVNLAATSLPVPNRPPRPFHFFVTLPLDADNSYQEGTLKVNFIVNAEQMRNNP